MIDRPDPVKTFDPEPPQEESEMPTPFWLDLEYR